MASKLSRGIASFEKPLQYLYNKQLKIYTCILYSIISNVQLYPNLLLIMHRKRSSSLEKGINSSWKICIFRHEVLGSVIFVLSLSSCVVSFLEFNKDIKGKKGY